MYESNFIKKKCFIETNKLSNFFEYIFFKII